MLIRSCCKNPSGLSRVRQAKTRTMKLVQNGSMIRPATIARHLKFILAIAYAHGSDSTTQTAVVIAEIQIVRQTMTG